MARTFTARYPQRDGCAQCGADIDAGDQAGYIDSEICCEDCCFADPDFDEEW